MILGFGLESSEYKIYDDTKSDACYLVSIGFWEVTGQHSFCCLGLSMIRVWSCF